MTMQHNGPRLSAVAGRTLHLGVRQRRMKRNAQPVLEPCRLTSFTKCNVVTSEHNSLERTSSSSAAAGVAAGLLLGLLLGLLRMLGQLLLRMLGQLLLRSAG